MWQRRIRGIAIAQLAVAGIGFAIVAIFWDLWIGCAYGYGAGLMLGNSIWLARRVSYAAGQSEQNGRRLLYRSAVTRFIALIAALVLAYGLALNLPVVVAGMFAAQFTFFIAGAFLSLRGELQG